MSRVWEKNERRREFIFLKIFEFFCGRFKIRNFYFFSGNSWFTYWSRWRMRVQNKKKKREGNTKNQNWPTGRENGNVAWRIPFAPSGVFVWVPAPCVRVSYDCEHQTFLSLPCAQTIAVCTRRTRWKRFFYLVGGGGVSYRWDAAWVSCCCVDFVGCCLCVVVCVLLSVSKRKNWKPHGALFRFSWREFWVFRSKNNFGGGSFGWIRTSTGVARCRNCAWMDARHSLD
jgi:hypothetical protein